MLCPICLKPIDAREQRFCSEECTARFAEIYQANREAVRRDPPLDTPELEEAHYLASMLRGRAFCLRSREMHGVANCVHNFLNTIPLHDMTIMKAWIDKAYDYFTAIDRLFKETFKSQDAA